MKEIQSSNPIERMYLMFRRELDEMWIPEDIQRMDVRRIKFDGKTVGMMCVRIVGYGAYIDCIYVLPKFRRRGLARKAVLEWYADNDWRDEIRLHIINNNDAAMWFWKSIFQLEMIERNDIDTLYRIVDFERV